MGTLATAVICMLSLMAVFGILPTAKLARASARNTGRSFRVYWAPFFLAGGPLLLGITVYTAHRRHTTEPEPVPPHR